MALPPQPPTKCRRAWPRRAIALSQARRRARRAQHPGRAAASGLFCVCVCVCVCFVAMLVERRRRFVVFFFGRLSLID